MDSLIEQPKIQDWPNRSKTGNTREWSTTPKASKSPTTHDIAWAAGIYEGEGTTKANAGTQMVCVVQKDPWILYRFQEFFGGTVKHRPRHKYPVYEWKINGTRARGFLYTIFTHLSPRRREQAKTALLALSNRNSGVRRLFVPEEVH